MKPDDALTLRGYSLQQEHLERASEGSLDTIDVQSLLRWYYAELDSVKITDPPKQS
jgi:hypothetical protein